MAIRARGPRLLWLGLTAALCLLAPGARADAQADFEKARAAYRAHAYEDAEVRFSALLDPRAPEKLEPQVASQARMYLGATYFAEKRKEEAGRVFEKLLVEDPRFEPDPLTFPTDVLNAFIDTHASIRERLNEAAALAARLEAEKRAKDEAEKKRQAERLRLLEQMAQEDKTTVRHSRLVASVPFGAGQFQNGQAPLGWVFLGIESALVLGTAITVPIYVDALQHRNSAHLAGDPDHTETLWTNRAATTQAVNLGLVAGLGAAMAAGVLQAHLAFVPESLDVKTRPIPQAQRGPTVAPWLSLSPPSGGEGGQGKGSGALGLQGTF